MEDANGKLKDEDMVVQEAVRECQAVVAELEEQLAVRAMLSDSDTNGGAGCSSGAGWYRGRAEMGLQCQVISSEALRRHLLGR